MRPPKRNRKPPARGASAAKAHRTSKRQKSKSNRSSRTRSFKFRTISSRRRLGHTRSLKITTTATRSFKFRTNTDQFRLGDTRFFRIDSIPAKNQLRHFKSFTIRTIAFSGKSSSSHRFNVNMSKVTRRDSPPPGGSRQLPLNDRGISD